MKVTASGDIAVNRNIYTEAYTGNAGAITLTSTNGAISTSDNAVLLARGLRGGNGGTVTLRADNGSVALGATTGNGTRIYTRGQGTGASGNGGDVILSARAVTLNRGVSADGSAGGSGGDVTITATAGNVTTQNIIARGGTVAGQAGRLTVTAAGSVATTGTFRAGVIQIAATGTIDVRVATESLRIGGDSAGVVGSIGGQSGSAAVGQLQIDNVNIPNPCTVNGFSCILPSPAPPAVGTATAAAITVGTDVAALAAAIDQARTPLSLRVADQETPAQEAFVQSPLIGAVPVDIFSGGYQLVRTAPIVPAAGRAEPADNDEEDDEERLDSIVPSAGPASEDEAAPTVEVDAYFTQDLWSGRQNP